MGRAEQRESAQQRGSSREEEQQRGSAAKWGSAVAARDSKEKRVF